MPGADINVHRPSGQRGGYGIRGRLSNGTNLVVFVIIVGRGLGMTFAPGRIRVRQGVEHQLAPCDRRSDREVRVPATETDPCGCRTVSGAQPAVSQLSESVGDGCDRAEDAPDAVAVV